MRAGFMRSPPAPWLPRSSRCSGCASRKRLRQARSTRFPLNKLGKATAAAIAFARLGWWRDRETPGYAVAFDQVGDQAGFLRLLDKLAQEGKRRRVLFRRAHGLLHRGKLTIEDARSGQLGGDIDQTGTQPGIGVHLLVDERLDRGVGIVELQQFAFPEVVFEPQTVGAARRHRGALAGLVYLRDALDRRAGRYQIGRLDLAIGRGEV